MLNENFVILGFTIQMFGSLRYLLKTIQGKVQPNKVTFFLWSFAPLIAFIAEIKQGVGIQALTTFSVGFSPLLIFIASFINKKATWKLGTFDLLCGVLSLAGLLLWYLTKVGNIALIFAIAADGLAALPTIAKAYYHPETEDGLLYLLSSVSVILTLLTITTWNFVHYGFPIYILIVNLIIFSLAQFKIGQKLAKLA